jgi:hypothetical protein
LVKGVPKAVQVLDRTVGRRVMTSMSQPSNIHDVYHIEIDWGGGSVDRLVYHLWSTRLFGPSWLLDELKLPPRVKIDDVDRLIHLARRLGAKVTVTEPWPPPFSK